MATAEALNVFQADTHPGPDADPAETQEWLDALYAVLEDAGPERARFLLSQLKDAASRFGAAPPASTTPYVNTIRPEEQPEFPGNRALERKIKSLVRWNAMAMVARGHNGGHISTFASAATLLEVGFNHFFRGPDAPGGGDLIYFQGHSSPGIYSRAFLEGRLPASRLENFRKELAPGGGLSSYPHPWLMPDFWQFPTVSMGLGPILSIYQARFNRYLEHRGLKETNQQHVWAYLGDGETDEPESLGAITLASREKLDNLTWIINCNLQRLDGPVRGNGKIIQELEAAFRGAGWNVIKVVWGTGWDHVIEKDVDGALVARLTELVDGEYQKFVVEGGAYIREHLFDTPELRALVEHLSDEQLEKMGRGGHDPAKVYAAYDAALKHKGQPTVILAKTVKGYGLGEAGEARNTTHQQKKLTEDALRKFSSRFDLSVEDEVVKTINFFKPNDDSEEIKYLKERRKALGGSVPSRRAQSEPLKAPPREAFKAYLAGSGKSEVSTTGAFVGILKDCLLRDPNIGKRVVPIIPDEARTFGMDPLFKPYGIYSNVGQLYDPVDSKFIASYREAQNGQILEEGITEAGAIASFIAAGSSYSTHGLPMIPFFIYYSMFGFQRVGDQIWLAGDMRVRGFLLGATAGRTTLNGEGLQHQDGHSHLIASTVPNVVAYDPAYAYEIAIIIQDGIRRMYEQNEDVLYYLTLGNEAVNMPAMPAGVEEGIIKGFYKLKPSPAVKGGPKTKVHLFGSAVILEQVLRAQTILAEQFNVAADVWSVTSYKELRRDALECERWNLLHPTETPRKSYLESTLEKEQGIYLAASDYMKAVPEMIDRWVPGGLYPLGTDGFGRSEDREALRRHFEVDAECIAVAALAQLAKKGEIKADAVAKAITALGVDPEKADPVRA